jgi:hypothetical protein
MPKNQSDRINDVASGLIAPQFIDNLPEDGRPVDVAAKNWRSLQGIDDALTQTVNSIDADDLITDKGKRIQIKEAAGKLLAEALTLKHEHAEFVGKHVRKAQREATPETIHPGAAATRQAEIRRLIAEQIGQDGLKMRELLSQAESVGDAETLAAIADAPLAWSQSALVPDHKALAETLAQLATDQLGEDISTLIQADRELGPKFENVQKRLELVLDGPDDPVGKLAKAGNDAEDSDDS